MTDLEQTECIEDGEECEWCSGNGSDLHGTVCHDCGGSGQRDGDWHHSCSNAACNYVATNGYDRTGDDCPKCGSPLRG